MTRTRVGLLVALMVTVLVLGAFAEGSQETSFVRIATGGTGGNYYRLGAGIASVWNDEIEGIVASTQSTDGSPHNAELLAARDVEVAFMGADVSRNAYENAGRFAEEDADKYRNMRFITYLYPNPQMFIVMEWAADQIESLEDIEGMRVSKGAIGSLGETYFLETCEVLGVDPDDVIKEDTVHGSAIDQVRNRQIDAVLWPDAAGSASHMEILDTGWAEARSLNREVIDHFTSGAWDINFPYTLPAETYPNQPEAVDTFAAPIVLLTRENVDEDLVYELTSQIYANRDALVSVAGLVAQFMTIDTALNGRAVPLHPGAERFYREQGVLD